MSRICDRSFTERASAAASCGDCKTLQITSKQRIWIVTAALAMDFVAESRNDHARVIRRGWGGKYNSGHNNTVAEGAMVSTGPPSIDREPGHRCSPVPTATLRGRASLEGQRRLAVLAAPLSAHASSITITSHFGLATPQLAHPKSHSDIRRGFQKLQTARRWRPWPLRVMLRPVSA